MPEVVAQEEESMSAEQLVSLERAAVEALMGFRGPVERQWEWRRVGRAHWDAAHVEYNSDQFASLQLVVTEGF